MSDTAKRLSLVGLLVFLPVMSSCGDGDDPTDGEPDSGMTTDTSNQSDSMQTDGGRKDSAMSKDSEGSTGCASDEWRRSTDMTCQSCPAAQLDCSSVESDSTSIDPTADEVTIAIQSDLSDIESAQLTLVEGSRVCQGAGGGGSGGQNCTVMGKSERQISGTTDGSTVTFAVTPADENSNWFKLEKATLTDSCGDQHTLDLTGSWLSNDDAIDELMSCQ